MTRTVGRLGLIVVPILLAGTALWIFVTQPLAEPMERDALITVAGIVGTVLSLGLTVTLLAAQHTAERHARVLYEEFRRERAWLGVLALLGTGLVLILAASLVRPTVATGWAALALTGALGIYAASLLPQLLDSLDPTKLAERVTDRTVRELRSIARANSRYPDPLLKPVARRGLEIASGMAVQGIAANDHGVVRAGFAGMRRVLVAFVEGSPTRGWDTEVINLAVQHLAEAVSRCVKESPVLLLVPALEELTTLSVDVQRTLEPNGAETVSGRLNSIFLDIVRGTLMNDQSAGAAMATRGIGAGALALIRARSPNMVADHIRKLRTVALGSMAAEKDHVAGEAHVELAKIAIALAAMDDRHDVMPPSQYQDACEALAGCVDAFVERASTSGGLMNDWAWTYVTMPHAQYNLAWVVVAGVRADDRRRDRYRSDFGHSATSLVLSLVKLGTEGSGGFSTAGHAIESAYMAVLGAMAQDGERRSPDLIPKMWRVVVNRLIDPTKEKAHEVEMLSALLLVGAYEAVSSRPSAPAMRNSLTEALGLTVDVSDDFHRRRRAMAWLDAGRAALGGGDAALADAIAAAVARDVRAFTELGRGHSFGGSSSFFNEIFAAAQSMPFPTVPDLHRQQETIAAFDALLGKHQSGRRARRSRFRRVARQSKRTTKPSGETSDG